MQEAENHQTPDTSESALYVRKLRKDRDDFLKDLKANDKGVKKFTSKQAVGLQVLNRELENFTKLIVVGGTDLVVT